MVNTGAPAASATTHEVRLVDATLAASLAEALPQRLMGDRAYDPDPPDAHLREQGIALIAPTGATGNGPRGRKDGSCGDIGDTGRWSGYLAPGQDFHDLLS
jgi:hypothetical protein